MYEMKLYKIVYIMQSSECPRGVGANVLDIGILLSEFELLD